MPINEWTVVYGTHQIRVVMTRHEGARLYVGDELLDTTNELYAAGDEATLAGTFGDKDGFRVEVFMKLSPAPKAAIRVNGEWVSGERVYAVA